MVGFGPWSAPGIRDSGHAARDDVGRLSRSLNGQASTQAAESPGNDNGEPMQTAQILKSATGNPIPL